MHTSKPQYISGKTVLKPYLRPMSSMTEDEKREMKLALSPRGTATFAEDGIHMPMTHTGDFVPYDFMERTVEWLRERHFDINGLTGKGKAIPIFRIYRYDDVMNRI